MSGVTHRYDVLESPLVARMAMLPIRHAVQLLSAPDPLEATRAFYASSPFARDALALASPSLAAALDAWISGDPPRNDRMPLSALSYALRMASRCTPFGLFAGVGPVEVGDECTLTFDPHAKGFRTQTRADMGLIGALIAELEKGETRKRLRYAANPCSFVRGTRLFVTNVELVNVSDSDSELSAARQRDVSLRHTDAVAFVREYCTRPTEYTRIADALCDRFGANLQESERLLDRLSSVGIIVSELRYSPLGDPTARLAARLEEIAPQRATALREALETARTLDATPVFEQTRNQRARARDHFSALAGETPTHVTQTDLRLAFSGTLGRNVVADVTTIAELAMRSGPVLRMQRYRERFEERYEGINRLVPLLELVDNTLGIGVPDDMTIESRGDAKREAEVLHLFAEAARANVEELDVSNGLFERIFPPDDNGRCGAIEVGFQLAASSPAAVAEGDYRMIPTMLFERPARSLGRFASMLGEEVIEQARAALRRTIAPNECVAEFTHVPVSARRYNVSLRPALYDYEIAVGVSPLESTIAIAPHDLFVGIEDDRFYLWSRTLGRRVSVRETHALMTSMGAPNLCRFLALLDGDGARRPEFALGSAQNATYIPRLTYGRIVLHERSWTFPRSAFDGGAFDAQRALETLRIRWNIPRYVYLCEGDNRLLLDFDASITARLLLEHATDSTLHFKEALPTPTQTWLVGPDGAHAIEFVAQAVPAEVAARETNPHVVRHPLTTRVRFGPASQWLYVKLYLAEQAVDDLLVSAIAPLMTELRRHEHIDRWFFVRYEERGHHLRLRVRVADSQNVGAVRDRLLSIAEEWLKSETVSRYVLDTYDPEYERYGGAEGLELAEAFFTVDSEVTINALAGSPATDARVEAAASTFDAFARASSQVDTLLLDLPSPTRTLGASDREALRRLRREDARPAPTALIDALQGDALVERLGALIHMHCNRFGLDRSAEQRVALLLRSLALSRAALATTR